jgi:8-oxo-dGTP diphosphatase
VVAKNDHILLGARAKEPYRGKWVLPGGGVRFLEALDSTAKREIQEEVGIDIKVGQILKVAEILNPPDEHRVVIYCAADYVGGEIAPSSDLADARFFSKEEVRSLCDAGDLTPTVMNVLRELNWV